MDQLQIYSAIRSEIIANHVLMHWISVIVAIVVLIGIAFVEKRATIVSVFLPLLSVSWAAMIVRFDFFIHRQGAYLQAFEAKLQEQGLNLPLWETWKQSISATNYLVPVADLLALPVIVIPTIYLLFGPSREFFAHKQWKGARAYAWIVLLILIGLLLTLAVIPKLANGTR